MNSATAPDDHEQIRQLLVGYCHAVDRALDAGEIADMSGVYHEDSTFAASWEDGRTYVGLAAILAWYDEFLAKRVGLRHTRHKMTEPEISVQGTSARSRAYFDADSIDRRNRLQVLSGRYDDELVKQDDKWLIKNRYVTAYYRFTAGETREYRG